MRKLKVGDQVFVVHLPAWRAKEGDPRKTNHATIEKVGSKYGYIRNGRGLEPFHLTTWKSVDKSGCERANGWGFDVYDSREQWEAKERAEKELARLRARLVGNWGELNPIDPKTVEAIHAILDQSRGIKK